ncbi:MAG: hypothetical protein ABJI96_22825 [Paracoccaceae bacterium]
MNGNTIGAAALALIIGTVPATAQSFRSTNWLTVNPVGPTEFEVIKKASTSPRAMWCAASDYSGRVLGRYSKTELIIVKPIGPAETQQGRNGVVFTIDAAQSPVEPKRSSSVTIQREGASMSAGHAKTLCGDNVFPFSGR